MTRNVLLAMVFALLAVSTAPAHSVWFKDALTTESLQRLRAQMDESDARAEWKDFGPGVRGYDVGLGNGKGLKEGDYIFIHLRTFDQEKNLVDDSYMMRSPVKYLWKRDQFPARLDDAMATMREGGKRVMVFDSTLDYYPGLSHFDPAAGEKPPARQARRFEISLLRVTDPPKLEPSFK